MDDRSPLAPVLRRAGAIIGTRDGRSVAVHYGSAAGELAACLRHVGLVDRSELALIEVAAAPVQLSQALERLTGARLATGGVAAVGDGWWCRAQDDRVLVVCPPSRTARLLRRLRGERQRSTGLEARDRSGELAAIGVIGRGAAALLAALGAFGPHGDPRRAAPFASARLPGVELHWLLQGDDRALAVVEARDARTAWESIERVGREHGLTYIGADAAERFSIAARQRDRHSHAPA